MRKDILLSRVLWNNVKEIIQKRSLPHFVIIGAQKSGTSSLYSYLSQHPQLLPSKNKEVHFFDGGLNPQDDNFQKGVKWYRHHFPTKQELGNNRKTFEASPLYIFNPLVPQRMTKIIPDTKIILLLRNPTERAISQYFHEKRLGFEPLAIFDALKAEEQRIESVIKEKDYKHHHFIHSTYKSRGLYKEQIDRYTKYFSAEQMLIINSHDLFNDTNKILERVFAFVGVDVGFKIENLKPQNVSLNRTRVDPSVYEYLDDYFAKHNEDLYKLLGEDFTW